MKKIMTVGRRGFLKGAAALSGAAVGSRIVGGRWVGDAHAAGLEKPAVVLLYLDGGYNSLFCSADSFAAAGKFGVNTGNIEMLGGDGGLAIDKATLGTLPAMAKAHIATIGVAHGISDHGGAQRHDLMMNGQGYSVMLASAMGGDASIKAANAGNTLPAGMTVPAMGGVSLQRINDMQTTIDALAGSADPRVPNRGVAATGLEGSQGMSKGRLDASPRSTVSLKDGYASGIDTLRKPAKVFDLNEFKAAYKLNGTAVNGFAAQMAAAELMIRAGTNVITMNNGGWDSHGDTDGSGVRGKLSAMMGSINTFVTRMIVGASGLDTTSTQYDPTAPRNVIFMVMGDFARSLPGSDHQSNMSATVIGKYVKLGTTGKTDANVGLPKGGPAAPGLWSYVSDIAKTPTNPFGANPHAKLVL